MVLQLGNEYGLVVAAVGVIGVSGMAISTGVMSVRSKVFKNPEFLAKRAVQVMRDEHKKTFGTEMNDMGYPDMGSGRYSAELPYADWVAFNNAQRAHYNMVENAAPVIGALIVSGLALPRVAATLGCAFAAGRLMYASGYKSSKGADGRMLGALFSALSSLGLFGIAIFQGIAAYASSS